MAKAQFDENDNGVDDRFEAQMAESVTEEPEKDDFVEVPLVERPCRNENEHGAHYWGDGGPADLYCEGRRRG